MATVKDPVCGMEIEAGEAAATSDYEGVTYYFCAVGCKQSFDADPARYVGGALRAPTAPLMASKAPGKEPAMTVTGGRKWWQFWKS